MSRNKYRTGIRTRNRIYEYIKGFRSMRGYAPSYREIADRFDLGVSVVYYHIGKLEEEGLLTRDRGVARSIRIVAK